MHEYSLVADLLRRVESIARRQAAEKVTGVKVTLGPNCVVSPAHLREHFHLLAFGTIAENARLDIEVSGEQTGGVEWHYVLEHVEVQSCNGNSDAPS